MREFSTDITLSHLVVVESLSDSERHTGRALVDDLASYCASMNFGIGGPTKPVATRTDLLHVMRLIAQHGSSGLRPILHLEVHGLPDRGLRLLPSGEYLSWPDFGSACRKIALATDNNFVVVMAVCHGFHAITDVNVRTVTPFTYLCGPQTEVTSGEIERAFGRFYRALLDHADFNEAATALPPKYGHYNCEQLLARVYAKYTRETCMGRGKDKRIDDLLTRIVAARGDAELTAVRRELKRVVRPSAQSFDKFRAQFLLADRPSNADRFTVTFEDVMEAIEKDIRAGH